MTRILSLNLDFVLILLGGLLLLLATASWDSNRQNHPQPWRWIGWYAFLQALRTGIDLTVYEGRHHALLDVLNSALIAVSALILVEFARKSFRKKIGRWIHLALLAGLAVVVACNDSLLPAWAGLAIAIGAGVFAGIALWPKNTESNSAPHSRSLRLVALILGTCQLVVALPDAFLENEMSFVTGDVPPAVLKAALFFLLTLAVLGHLQSGNKVSRPATQSAERNRRRLFCAIVIIALGLAGWIGAGFAGQSQDESMRQQILARTQIAAASIPADDVALLHWNESDLTNPAYVRLKALMISMRHANADLRFVLLAGIKEQRAFFLVDSEDPKSPDYSPPGQSYDEATADYLAGLAAGRPFVLGPETDRWGTWVFGDAPILDAKGRLLAYLELDVAAADWAALVRHARLPVLLITLLIVALVLGSFQALERLRDSSAEIALSEQRNRSLVEGSPDCVQMFDLTGHYVAVNQNGLRALGLTEAEVLGRHFSSLWPPETRPKIDEAIRATVAGKPTTLEADYALPDGKMLTWRVATNPVYDTAGRVRSFVGICVDLTVRKQAELALLAAKKAAEDATQAKSDFMAVMSHEIRTPLAGVIGMLDLLQQAPLEPQPRRYTKFARDSADTLLHLLDDALDAAKMEAGKLALETIPFRPHEQFEAAFESASMRADAKGIVFRHEVAPSVPAVLLGDPTRLRQIINNLVNNALKFTEKGSVGVTLNAVPIGIGTVFLKIAVTDTGIGISEEARARLFSRYAQADASTTRHYGGTGLGLSIVKSLAELMGGEVNVTSTLGQGSTFTFSGGFRVGNETPRSAKPAASALATPPPPVAKLPPPAPVRAQPSRQLRVLVVDDDVSNRTVAESLVSFLGHREVVFAVNGREAVNRLMAEKFDVVLMDNRMPIMDGFTATRLIRDPATGVTDPSIYIVALTANASTDDRAKCLQAGMNDYITKPVRAPDMGAALARAIEHLRNGSKVASPPAPAPSPATPAPVQNPPGLSEAELLAALDADEAAAAQAAPAPVTMPPGTIEKITAIFLQESPRRFEAMRAAFERQDATTLGMEAHTLKSNARYLNAVDLSELCARLESLADKKQFGEIGPLLSEAEGVYTSLRERLLHPLSV